MAQGGQCITEAHLKSENVATLTYNVQRDTFRIISTRLIGSLKIGMAEEKKK